MTLISRDERQNQCIENWKKAGGRATILAATGFGKTRIAIKVIKRLIEKKEDSKILVVVPSDYLKTQWLLQLAEMNLLQYTQVMIINTVIKRKTECDLLVCDEVHEYAAETFSSVFTGAVKYRLLLCLTGTLNRLDGKERLIKEFAPVCDSVDLKTCLANKWLAEYKEYKVMLDVDLTEYKAINVKFLNHFSFFNYEFDLAMACVTGFNTRLTVSKQMGCTVKDVTLHAIQFIKMLKLRKEFVWNHVRKTELANLIIEHRKDKKILTFSQTKDMAESIKYGKVMHSGQSKKVRAKIMEEFSKAESGVINSAKALERGADIPGLSIGIVLSFNSSSIAKNQKNGRSLRKEGDKVSELFTFVIRGTMEDDWFNKSAKGLNYTTITEDQLLALLKGEDHKKVEKPSEFLFTI